MRVSYCCSICPVCWGSNTVGALHRDDILVFLLILIPFLRSKLQNLVPGILFRQELLATMLFSNPDDHAIPLLRLIKLISSSSWSLVDPTVCQPPPCLIVAGLYCVTARPEQRGGDIWVR